VQKLIATGANVRARRRRGAEPLHYAVDGMPGSLKWSPPAQAATVTRLIEAGADPNATNKSGVTPLHRAVRTRCSAAVKALLEGGADEARQRSKPRQRISGFKSRAADSAMLERHAGRDCSSSSTTRHETIPCRSLSQTRVFRLASKAFAKFVAIVSCQ
jgi:ankyrin repeat protein